MRPSNKQPGAVWRLLEAWMATERWKPTQLEMAEAFGVSKSLITDWKYAQSRMQPDEMRRVSEVTGIELAFIASAVVEDSKKDGDGNDELRAAPIAARKNPKRPPRGPQVQQPD